MAILKGRLQINYRSDWTTSWLTRNDNFDYEHMNTNRFVVVLKSIQYLSVAISKPLHSKSIDLYSICSPREGILDKNHVSRSTFPNTRGTSLHRSWPVHRLSFHMIGKEACLATLWQNPVRSDKPWNYVALEFQRYTKHVPATGNLYGHVENVWGIPFPKEKKQKYFFLGVLFQEYYNLTTKWLWLQSGWLQIDYRLTPLQIDL
jgi:hypothetical protein